MSDCAEPEISLEQQLATAKQEAEDAKDALKAERIMTQAAVNVIANQRNQAQGEVVQLAADNALKQARIVELEEQLAKFEKGAVQET